MEGTLRKISITTGFLVLAMLFALIALRANGNIVDSDTWFHIRTGEYISHHGIPTTDVYSFPLTHKPWIDHEWLWQVLLYSLYLSFGDWGLISLQWTIVVSIFWVLLLMGYEKERLTWLCALLLLSALVDPGRSLMRPDIVSLWFSVMYIYFLEFSIKRKWFIYALLILQVLWTNIHGFFILGPFIILLYLAAECAKRHFKLPYEWNSTGRLDDDDYGKLKKVWVILILSCFINPYFWKGFFYPIKILLEAPSDAKFLYSYVGELHRPISRDNFANITIYPAFKSLIALSIISFMVNIRKIDLRVFLYWFIFLGFSMAASRNVVFIIPAAYWAIVSNLSQGGWESLPLISKAWPRTKYIITIMLQIALIGVLGFYGSKLIKAQEFFDVARLTVRSSYGLVSDQKFPLRMEDFLMNPIIKGNFFNNLEVGHPIITRQFPQIKVFVDGRVEVYGTAFLRTYQKIWDEGDWEAFQRQVDTYNVTGAILSLINRPLPIKFMRQIYSHPEWKLVYFDYDGLVFLKDTPQNKEAIDRFSVDLAKWKATPLKNSLKVHSSLAIEYYSRAVTLKNLGFFEQAKSELDEALECDPSNVKALTLDAQIYRDTGNHKRALELFQKAHSYSPRSIGLMKETAFAYESVGDYDSAMGLGQKIINQSPTDPRGYFVLSRMLARKKQHEASFVALTKACEFGLKGEDVLSMIDVFYDEKAYDWAKKACDLKFDKKKYKEALKNKLELIQKAEGNLAGSNKG